MRDGQLVVRYMYHWVRVNRTHTELLTEAVRILWPTTWTPSGDTNTPGKPVPYQPHYGRSLKQALGSGGRII